MSIACQIQNQHLLQFRLFQVFLLSVLLFVFNGRHFIKEHSKSQVRFYKHFLTLFVL